MMFMSSKRNNMTQMEMEMYLNLMHGFVPCQRTITSRLDLIYLRLEKTPIGHVKKSSMPFFGLINRQQSKFACRA